MPGKARVFWPLLLLMVLADCTTKRLAEEHLAPAYVPYEVVGDVVRLTLAYNPGAATGLHLGSWSRGVFALLAFIVLVVLASMYRKAASSDWRLAVALALVAGGAIGNLLDRLRSARGVVDFIDVGLGAHRFWTFNVADIGISVGGVLLTILLWRRDDTPHRADTAK